MSVSLVLGNFLQDFYPFLSDHGIYSLSDSDISIIGLYFEAKSTGINGKSSAEFHCSTGHAVACKEHVDIYRYPGTTFRKNRYVHIYQSFYIY